MVVSDPVHDVGGCLVSICVQNLRTIIDNYLTPLPGSRHDKLPREVNNSKLIKQRLFNLAFRLFCDAVRISNIGGPQPGFGTQGRSDPAQVQTLHRKFVQNE